MLLGKMISGFQEMDPLVSHDSMWSWKSSLQLGLWWAFAWDGSIFTQFWQVPLSISSLSYSPCYVSLEDLAWKSSHMVTHHWRTGVNLALFPFLDLWTMKNCLVGRFLFLTFLKGYCRRHGVVERIHSWVILLCNAAMGNPGSYFSSHRESLATHRESMCSDRSCLRKK